MTTDAQCKQETTRSQETADDIRKSLSRRALEYSRFGHESACQDWRDLETKLRAASGRRPAILAFSELLNIAEGRAVL
jgi:hypothetical protein